MEKLKTWEDLSEDMLEIIVDEDYSIALDDVKDEAIKWVKELRCGSSLSWTEKHPFYEFRHDTYPIAEFIKNRFNLTEEDLK